MTNTLTADADSTVKQIIELYEAGSELVRCTVEDFLDAQAVPKIREKLDEQGFHVPLIGDFHYNGHLLLKKDPECAEALDKLRINPGNVGVGKSHDENFKQIIDMAVAFKKPVRIGVNFGSIDQRIYMKLMDDNARRKQAEQKNSDELAVEAMCQSAAESEWLAKQYGMKENQIILSTKVSSVPLLIEAYTKLASTTEQPLHLGLTEAGLGEKGIIAATAGISALLNKGIGDTIRVSITPSPGMPRTQEVAVARQILQVNGLRYFSPSVTSCPGCGRTTSTLFQEIADEITKYLNNRTPAWKKEGREKVSEMKVAVMGCIVNGPGESRHANIGLSLPGNGEDPVSPVYADGKEIARLSGKSRIDDFKKLIEEYVERHY